MFSKPTRSSETAEGASLARKPAIASLIAEGVTVRGDITAEGDLHLDGVLEGDLTVDRLTLGESATVRGVITADAVEVRGRVCGAINARQVRLHATARVEGDISHAELAIEAGARFEGRSQIFSPSAPAEPLALANAAE